MNRQWRKTVPLSLFVLLMLLFTVALPLSFNVLNTNASDGNADPFGMRVINPLYGVLDLLREAEDKLNPQDQIIIATKRPTATRTPTPVNIGNFVWDDFDKDGRQDAGEPGLPGVTVQLWNSTKTQLIDSAVTNASGIYSVTAPTPGNYRLRVLRPSANDTFSPRDQAGGNDQLDSDIIDDDDSISYGFTLTFNLASNVISTTIMDAGIIIYRPPTPTRTPTPINVGNFVWDDLDKDGRQDAGEPGLAGVVVQLWNSGKTQMLYQTTTNSSGIYSVIAPVPGQYRVRIVLPGLQDEFTVINAAGGDDQLDSDINPEGVNIGFTDIITLGANLISTTIVDGGIIIDRPPTPTRTPTPINIGNFVWNDVNANGVQDAGEKGLNGITVQLWSSDKSQLISSAVTNSNGNYYVVAPLPGDYRIRVLKPAGSSYSPSNQGGDDQKDSDITSSIFSLNIGYSGVITLASNVISTTTWDAGIYNVAATPSYTPSSTKTNTPIPASNSDTIALYSKQKTKFALVDTLAHPAPPESITKVNSNAPVKGQFVMGDWNNDGQATPGLYKAGMFWYTNTFGGSAVWSNVWLGEYNRPAVVAGRFSAAFANDCFGIVERDHDLPGDGFPLYYTCELLIPIPPSGIQNQFLAISLPGSAAYQFVAGDWDNDGIDTIAVRRENTIVWGNIGPAEGVATFPSSQTFGDPFDGYGDIVAGDWNNNGIDTFGLFFKQNGKFYYRNDLGSAVASYLVQKIGKPIGDKVKPFSWREVVEIRSDSSGGGDDLLPLPGTPVNGMPPQVTLTPSMLPDVSATQTPDAPSATPAQETFETVTATAQDLTPTLTPTPSYFPTVTLAVEVTDTGDTTD
jgi:hypothetical protein